MNCTSNYDERCEQASHGEPILTFSWFVFGLCDPYRGGSCTIRECDTWGGVEYTNLGQLHTIKKPWSVLGWTYYDLKSNWRCIWLKARTSLMSACTKCGMNCNLRQMFIP
jgi:hypothetical protein